MVGGLFFRVVLVGACLGLAALLAAIFHQAQHIGGASQAPTTVGIDVEPSGNSAASLGDIDACVSVATGQTFDADIFVTDVPELAGWQAIFYYDGAVVNIADTDVELFLATNAESDLVNLSADPLPDKDSAYIFAVVDLGDHKGEAGSGVLARLTLEAVGAGSSGLALSELSLVDVQGQAMGDADGDQVFDGSISGAQVWVDQPCPSAPLPTLVPPRPTITPPTVASPTATPATPGPGPATVQPASPTAATPTMQPTTDAVSDEGGDEAFPWAVVAGATAGSVLAALALGFVLWRVARRLA